MFIHHLYDQIESYDHNVRDEAIASNAAIADVQPDFVLHCSSRH